MKTFIISDLHINHANVIEYCNRPFKNVEEMNKKIIKSWNSVVSNEDTVFVLGDLFFKGTKEFCSNIISQLNGKIILICGNHDMKSIKWYLDCGIKEVYKRPILYKDNIIMKHTPPDKNVVSKDFIYLFGHTHNKASEVEDFLNCFNVSCERLDYKPIDLDELILKIKDKV